MSYCQGGGTGCTTNNGNIWQTGLGTLNIAPNVTDLHHYQGEQAFVNTGRVVE